MDAIFKNMILTITESLIMKEFSMFFANRGSGNNPNVNQSSVFQENPPIKLLKRLKKL